MEINLPPIESNVLAGLANEAGYDSVERYVADYVVEFAQHHATPDLPPLTDEQLQASLAMCDQGMAEAEAGEGIEIREALGEIAEKHGLKIDE